MKKILLAAALSAALLSAHDPKKGAATSITGTVVDVACFVGHDSIGEKHVTCAEACARAGNPLAIYDATAKKLYLPIAMDHKNPNTKLMPFIEKKVTAKGRVITKAGMTGIVIDAVTPAP